MISPRFPLLFLALGLGATGALAAPRVAVFDAGLGTKETRFKIDTAHLDQVTSWLKEAGIEAVRVNAAQINDPAAFGADRFDALMMPGDSFPLSDAKSLQKFADGGGVLVSLGQGGRVPFLVSIAPKPDGTWTMSPAQPAFAWQSDAIYGALGIHYEYNPGKHDQGVVNSATPLLQKYLPRAPDIPGKLPSVWLTPTPGAEFYPLVRSRRLDGADVPPPFFISKKGADIGIVATQDFFTAPTNPALWPLAKQTVLAMAQIAADLRSGALKLSPDMKIDLPSDLAAPEPLRFHLATSSVEPEGAKPVVRWGKFDGTSFDLGDVVAAGKTVEVAANADPKTFPRGLAAGASVSFTMPAMGAAPEFLRVRGGFNQSDAGLAVTLGKTALWNEKFNYLDAGGQGNFSAPTLTDVAAEWTRNIFLPAGQGTALTLSNPGTKPVYFDALQVETRPVAPPTFVVGMGAGFGVGYGGKNVIPRALSEKWGAVRAVIRPQDVGPPGDPKRWDRLDRQMQNYISMGAPIHALFEGTPKWAPISQERYKASSRPQNIPPDNAKFAEWVAEFIGRYGDHVTAYELWNEADSGKFWQGTYPEYVDFVKAVAPVVRKLAPNAVIQTTGMAGFKDTFFEALINGGVMPDFDWVAYHAYAGKSTAWDISWGQAQGYMMAAGIDKPLNNNEQGFVWKNAEWFVPSPNFTPTVQANWLDKAMARLLANGVTKVSAFHAGGDAHPFGLIDENGVPRPGYAVMQDYFELNDGHRLDFSMTGANSQPLQGVYAIGSAHPDGSVTVILNPAEVPQFQKPYPETIPNATFDDGEGWSGFGGKPKFADGQVTLAPGQNSKYMGWTTPVSFDLERAPLLQIVAPAATGTWTASLRYGDKNVELLSKEGPGTFEIDAAKLAGAQGRIDGELTFRATGSLTLDSVGFVPRDGAALAPLPAPPTPAVLPVVLRIPLEKVGVLTGTFTTDGVKTPVAGMAIVKAGGQSFVQVPLELKGRGVLTLTP